MCKINRVSRTQATDNIAETNQVKGTLIKRSGATGKLPSLNNEPAKNEIALPSKDDLDKMYNQLTDNIKSKRINPKKLKSADILKNLIPDIKVG